MGIITIRVPHNIQEEYETDNWKIIENLLRNLKHTGLKKETKKDDMLTGLFSDEPDLIDKITESAMQAREKNILR